MIFVSSSKTLCPLHFEHRTKMASSTVRRALTNASSITASPRAASQAQGKRRLMGTAAAGALPLEEQPIEIQIFDIFDAPSRLGESSKMLAQTLPTRTPTRSDRVMSSATDRPGVNYVKPLPAPIMYDGPAQPGRLPGGYRAQRSMSGAAASDKAVVTSLPPPIVFDGPSKLRPYGRDVSGQSVGTC